MKTLKFFIASLAVGAFLFSACSKKTEDPNEKDAIVHFTVLDAQGKPLGGVPILIYDEKGYEDFKLNKTASPVAATLTLPDGKVNYRLPYQKWFAAGSRTVAFVVKQEDDSQNYRVWAVSRTIKAAEKVKIEFKLDKNMELPSVSTLDMYNENNGKTLFGNAVYLNAAGKFVGDNRYSFVDAGRVSGLAALEALKLDGFSGEVPVQPGHGYFLCKDISMMEFPSGRWGLSIASEYSEMYVTGWIQREGKTVGASVQYLIRQPEEHGLPGWGTVYNVKLKEGGSVTIPLSNVSNDSECATPDKTLLRPSFGADHVTIQITDSNAKVGKQYKFYIRSGAYYTEAKLQVAA